MYLQGFGNIHQTEAVPGALPLDQNSPQQCAFGLYAEQLSGSAFTRARHQNLRSWLYRLLPTVSQGSYKPYENKICDDYDINLAPNPLRWLPFQSQLTDNIDFIDSLFHVAGTPSVQSYLYDCNVSMTNRYFSSLDGELLFVPYSGEIHLHTEFGQLLIKPGMIAVIPPGVKFTVHLITGPARGYLCENAGSPLTLPQLGPIGANGLANPRHFNYPKASIEEGVDKATIICKYQNKLWTCQTNHSPLNVVAWYGNYAPYCYDLSLFNTINTVSFDHPDPSIFTVLTSESEIPGVSNLDFVIFPPRWMVAENTFRLPYFHRNCMSELMGLITGTYDAKQEDFLPGGISIHNRFVPHGPDVASYESCSTESLKPELYTETLAFMFETKDSWQVTNQALNHPSLQKNYMDCWQKFSPGSVT